MAIITKCKNVFIKALTSGSTPQQLTLSSCVGLYIAFSPFPGGHMLMTIASSYLFGMHFPTVFIASSFNNPWTMIPFYSFDYAFGYWLIHSLLGWEPSWTISLARLLGSGKICLVSFLIGGNLLGFIVAVLSYPIIRKLFFNLARMTNVTPSKLDSGQSL